MAHSTSATQQATDRAAENWLLSILESSNDAILSGTLDGRFSSANQAACRLFGYTPAEFLTLSVNDIVVPEDHALIAKILERVRRGERVEPYRAQRLKKSGERFPALLSVSAIFDSDAEVVGYSSIVRDLSAETRAEVNRRLLETLIDSSSDAIYSYSLEGTISSWNPSAVRLFGYSTQEMVGRSMRVLVPPEGEGELGGFTEAVANGRVVQDYQTIRLTKAGHRIPIALNLFPIRDDSGGVTGIGSIARDLQRTAELQKTFRKLKGLSAREREVLGLLAEGMSNSDIASTLGLSEQTIKNYISRILLKLGTTTRSHAAAEFLTFRSFIGPSHDS